MFLSPTIDLIKSILSFSGTPIGRSGNDVVVATVGGVTVVPMPVTGGWIILGLLFVGVPRNVFVLPDLPAASTASK